MHHTTGCKPLQQIHQNGLEPGAIMASNFEILCFLALVYRVSQNVVYVFSNGLFSIIKKVRVMKLCLVIQLVYSKFVM